MSIKKRRITLTTDGAGAAEGILGLGAKYAKVIAVGVGAPAGEASTDFVIEGNDGRNILTVAALDADPAVRFALADAGERHADDGAANATGSGAVVAESPATVTIANGGATKTYTVDLFCEI